MTDRSVAQDDKEAEDVILADGVDDEPAEQNRRIFVGISGIALATIATLYAAFHMLALNGVSLSNWTGIDLPFLPQFPLETWNFRIVHVAGALALGFLLFSAHRFSEGTTAKKGLGAVSLGAALLVVPALVSGVTAIGFLNLINSGTLPQMGGLTT